MTDYIYKDSMTKVFQYEYVLFVMVSDLFKAVEYSSRCIERLGLYYAELIKENKTTGHLSYEKQYEMEEEIEAMVRRDVSRQIVFPGIHMCKANVSVKTMDNGMHTFIFTDGIYGFSVSLMMGKNNRPKGIRVDNLKGVINGLTKEKPVKVSAHVA